MASHQRGRIRQTYVVGWIAALAVERAMAEAMIDEQYEEPDFEQLPHDPNAYTFGRIGSLNVVIASLKSEEIGSVSAADTAKSMLFSFPDIRIGLLVGIGAGAVWPEKDKDVRLGDIVVSNDKKTGGVVQYDLQKIRSGNIWESRGVLNKPPAVLLGALAKLKTSHLLRGSTVPAILKETMAKYPLLAEPEDGIGFVHQGWENDNFFRSQYEHPPDEADCNRCDRSQAVPRKPRKSTNPKIHYGIIASGDTVIADATFRDTILKRVGENCLCFEMEAAGLMNSFPCLVIRGISDYADSHKNDRWQPYAAATAAAFAKELLGYVHVPDVQATLRAKDTLDGISEDVRHILEESRYTRAIQKELGEKIDLNTLPIAEGAAFDSQNYELDARCHPDTRRDLIHRIAEWAQDTQSQCIFWLNGMAGTGKSTISRTVAQSFADQGQLGASFFFKRGEGDRGNASRLFTTIIHQLVYKIPMLKHHVQKAIESEPEISRKTLKQQFDRLIYQPFTDAGCTSVAIPTCVIVIDALDECEREGDIRTILHLLSRSRHITTTRLKIFLTSRPELPIRLGFSQIPEEAHQDVLLHDLPLQTIHHDIYVFLQAEFMRIRSDYNALWPTEPLSVDWPGVQKLEIFTNLAVPLFIAAATLCRFIGDARSDPQERLDRITQYQTIPGMSQLERTYLPVLDQLLLGNITPQERDDLCGQFREIVGSVVLLAEPLSTSSLAKLLGTTKRKVDHSLHSLHSVLRVPSDPGAPVQLLHLSFRDFLLNNERCREGPFAIDEAKTHLLLVKRCITLLQGAEGLRENICRLGYPGARRASIDGKAIENYLPRPLQYACQYWVYHLQKSGWNLCDQDEIHVFLLQHFLHWLEALSLMGKISQSIGLITTLQTLASTVKSNIAQFCEDAIRFVLQYRGIMDLAPLQIYSSAILFSPMSSIVRQSFNSTPEWLIRLPKVPEAWASELLKLEGHTRSVNAVAFSPDGQFVASGSDDWTVRLWNAMTGEEILSFRPHWKKITNVAFSPDSQLLGSRTPNGIVTAWSTATGEKVENFDSLLMQDRRSIISPDRTLKAEPYDIVIELQSAITGDRLRFLKGHSGYINDIIFFPDSRTLASASDDETVRVWDIVTGRESLRLGDHFTIVTALAVSSNGEFLASVSHDKIRRWSMRTREELPTIEGHCGRVNMVAFSPDGQRLASASHDKTVRIWSTAQCKKLYNLGGHSSTVTDMVFSPDGQMLASAAFESEVRLWDVTTFKEIRTLQTMSGQVRSLAISVSGQLLASGSNSGTIELWNVSQGEVLWTLAMTLAIRDEAVEAVAISPDDQTLASGCYDGKIRLWNIDTGYVIRTLAGTENVSKVLDVAFSPDGKLLASSDYHETVLLWSLPAGEQLKTIRKASYGADIQFSVDGQYLEIGRGIARLDSDPGTVSFPDPPIKRDLCVINDWVFQNGRGLLWLPQQYRGSCWANYGNILAIGQYHGHVTFLEFGSAATDESSQDSSQSSSINAAQFPKFSQNRRVRYIRAI